MALMHIIFTSSDRLDTVTKTKGNMIFVQDTKEIYVDFDSTSRVQVGLDNIDFPSSLPANGGNADTVGNKHASDFAASSHTHDNRYYTESEIDVKFANFKSSSIDVRTSDPTNPAVGYMWITTN